MNKINKLSMTIIICVLSIILYWFVTEKNQYIPLLVVLYICPFFLLFNRFAIEKDEILLYLLVISLFGSSLFHPETFRIETILYSTLFVFLFIYYRKLCNRGTFDIYYYLSILRKIIYAYFYVLIIQQFCVCLNISIFNWVALEDNRWKVNSLSMEPSHTALILTLFVFSYCYVKELLIQKKYDIKEFIGKDRFIWFSYLYVLFTTANTTVFFAVPVLFLYFIRIKTALKYLIPLFCISCLAFILVSYIGSGAWTRFCKLVPALLSFDPVAIYNFDPSASARISPFLIYFKDINLFSFDFWFGHGIDYAKLYLTNYLLGYVPDTNTDLGIGGVVNFFYDYGLVSGLLFFVCLVKMTMKRFFSYQMLMWITLFSIVPFNVYIQWLFWIIMTTNLYFYKLPKYIKNCEN